MNYYNARISKNGNHVNLSFVEGDGDDRAFHNASLKIGEHGRYSVKLSPDGKTVHIIVTLSSNQRTEKPKAVAVPLPSDDLPF